MTNDQFDLEKIAKEGTFKIFEGGNVLDCLGACLSAGYFPLNVDGVRELRNKGIISKGKWYDTSTVLIDGVQRDATLDELKNIKHFYKKGGRVLFADDWGSSGGIGSSSDLDSSGRFVGVPLVGGADARKMSVYDDALKFIMSDNGREYLVDNPDKVMDLYKALGPALMKNK